MEVFCLTYLQMDKKLGMCPTQLSDMHSTVSASILQSFDFVIAVFTPPARPLLTRAAALERCWLVRLVACHRTRASAASTISRCPWSAAWRSARTPAGERSDEQQISSRAAGQQHYPSSYHHICGRNCALRRPISCPSSPTRSLALRAASEQPSGA